jgi:hypothetical protein
LERGRIDVPGSARIVPVEVCDKIGCREVPSRFPAVVADIVAFPLDQIFDSAVSHATIQYLLDFKVFVAVDQCGGRRGTGLSSWDGVRNIEREFRDGEDSVEATKRSWEG